MTTYYIDYEWTKTIPEMPSNLNEAQLATIDRMKAELNCSAQIAYRILIVLNLKTNDELVALSMWHYLLHLHRERNLEPEMLLKTFCESATGVIESR